MDSAAGWILDLMPGLRPTLAGIGEIVVKFNDDAAKVGDELDGISKSIAKKIDDTSEQIAKEDKAAKEKAEQEAGKPKPITLSNLPINMQDKILYGERVPNPRSSNGFSNEIRGGHSPKIKNHPDFAVEIISNNPDGTTKVKFTKQFPDNASKIKTSTLAPDSWSEQKIIDTTIAVANTPAVITRLSDRSTFHRQTVDGVTWEVIRDSSGNVTSSYPTGGTYSNNL
jgi:hypothetical protein